ncbi:MAG: S4 domain-containing protein, partial [Polyangiaceae bacterium]
MSAVRAQARGHAGESLVAGTALDLRVSRECAGTRLDLFLARAMPVSRSELKRWIDHDRVTVG